MTCRFFRVPLALAAFSCVVRQALGVPGPLCSACASVAVSLDGKR